MLFRSLGAARQLHTVIAAWCNGCELCLASCPVDCIHMVEWPHTGPRPPLPDENRARYRTHEARRAGAAGERDRELARLKHSASPERGATS